MEQRIKAKQGCLSFGDFSLAKQRQNLQDFERWLCQRYEVQA
ncbi:hypothetical protein [Rodentibacter ratti]|nr:hypothetical protein [Rodentibacter ratti]